MQHPWVGMAEAIEPIPLPCRLNVESLSFVDDNQMKQDAAILTVANGGGLATVFLTPEDIDNVITSLQKVRDEMTTSRLYVGGVNGVPRI